MFLLFAHKKYKMISAFIFYFVGSVIFQVNIYLRNFKTPVAHWSLEISQIYIYCGRLLEVFNKYCLYAQGRRRVLKSGTAIKHHRRSARAEGTSGGRVREGE